MTVFCTVVGDSQRVCPISHSSCCDGRKNIDVHKYGTRMFSKAPFEIVVRPLGTETKTSHILMIVLSDKRAAPAISQQNGSKARIFFVDIKLYHG